MSEALTPDAPETFSAAPSDEETAPVGGTAADDGSAEGDTTKFVEATRFNGLMSKFNSTQAELATTKAQLAELANRLIQPEENNQVVDDSATLAELQSLRQELAAERMQSVRERVLNEYPEAKPFADLIVGQTPEEVESVAAAIALRMKGLTASANEGEAPPATETAPPVAEAPPVAPVVGGGSVAPVDAGSAQRVADAIKAGSWTDYWAAKSGPSADLA